VTEDLRWDFSEMCAQSLVHHAVLLLLAVIHAAPLLHEPFSECVALSIIFAPVGYSYIAHICSRFS